MNTQNNQSFRKIFEYLRISVTDRCNLRCIYCLPSNGIPKVNHHEIITFEEIINLVKILVKAGIKKVRLTGGEPLIRRGIVDLVKELTKIDGIYEVTMTTNGILLPIYAKQLKEAGLKRVNISLDSLNSEKFNQITRGGNLTDVLNGINSAIAYNLKPVKINTVLIPNLNDNEIFDFAKFAFENPVIVRFIERMPFNNAAKKEYISNNHVYQLLTTRYELIEEDYNDEDHIDNLESKLAGPAKVYKLVKGKGKIGFISPFSAPFCKYCNRLRLSAKGVLYYCLDSNDGISVKNCTEEQIIKIILQLEEKKIKSNKQCASFNEPCCISLSEVGG